jgi:hypothetical protein
VLLSRPWRVRSVFLLGQLTLAMHRTRAKHPLDKKPKRAMGAARPPGGFKALARVWGAGQQPARAGAMPAA